MKFKIKGARLAGVLVPALALAVPAFAQVRDPTLSDATEPGSVIVFPKFNNSIVALPEGGDCPCNRARDRRRLPKGCYLRRAPAGKDQVPLGLRHE